MKELKKFDVFSVGKIESLLLAVMGLFIGVIYGVIVAIIGTASGHPGLGILGFFGVIIFLPIVYGVLGLIMGLLTGLFYNWIAKKVGGLEFELVDKKR